jgi:hypothetical protein
MICLIIQIFQISPKPSQHHLHSLLSSSPSLRCSYAFPAFFPFFFPFPFLGDHSEITTSSSSSSTSLLSLTNPSSSSISINSSCSSSLRSFLLLLSLFPTFFPFFFPFPFLYFHQSPSQSAHLHLITYDFFGDLSEMTSISSSSLW